MARLVAVAQLIRVDKPLVAAVYSLVGAYLGADLVASLSPTAVRAAIALFLVVAFGFAINDLRDAPADALSKPMRPIPSGRISSSGAAFICLLLAASALIMASTVAVVLVALSAVQLLLSAAYSYYLKKTMLTGNLTVALLSASILPYGALAVGELNLAVMVGAGLTFIFIIAQEVLFALLDETNDRDAGVLTTAVRFGTASTTRLFQLLVAALFLAVLILPAVGWASAVYLWAAVPFSLLPAGLSAGLLGTHPSNQQVHLAARLIRFASYASLLPVALLR